MKPAKLQTGCRQRRKHGCLNFVFYIHLLCLADLTKTYSLAVSLICLRMILFCAWPRLEKGNKKIDQ